MKITNEYIDQCLKDRMIKRVGDYVSLKTPIDFRCLVCIYLWKTRPDIVLHGTGCPRCAGQVVTNEDIDRALIGKNMIRLDDYVNKRTPIRFQCEIKSCNNIIKRVPKYLINKDDLCPTCAGNKKIDEFIKDKNFIRLDNYVNCKVHLRFQCLEEDCCFYIWKATPDCIINDNNGCPKCAGNIKYTNEEIDLMLKDRNIKRLDDYDGMGTPIKLQCLIKNCNIKWTGMPRSFCPQCSALPNEKLVGMLLSEFNITFEKQKYIKEFSNIEKSRIHVDYYIPEINTIIEYNGNQHYEPVCFGNINETNAEINFIKQQVRDKYLQQFCINNNINLIWINGKEYRYNKLRKYMTEIIIPQLLLKSAS